MKAMLLAAGAGTRLRPLTYQVPKPLIPVANRPVIHYVLENLARHGIKEIIVNLFAHADQIRSYCGDGSRWGLKIQYSHEPILLGTAGGVKKVEAFFKDGPFFVMSGDGLSDINLSEMLAFHKKKRALATMAVKAIDSRFEYGVTLAGKTGRIESFLEKPSWGDIFSNTVNTGIYLFEFEALKYIPKNKVYDFGHNLWPKLLKLKKPIYAYDLKSYWTDVGNLAEYRKSQIDCLDGKIRFAIPGREIIKGIWIEEPASVSSDAILQPPCLIGQNARIDAYAEIGPHTVIGANSKIYSHAVLKNCMLFDNVIVEKNAHLSNCIVGAGGRVKGSITVYEAAVLNMRHQ
jgi:mannose-1-phosphate guanylyltransferase/phosphomannomutase